MARFGRIYKLVIEQKGGGGQATIEPPMQIEFDIAKDAKEHHNEHRIRVYNLKEATRKSIETPDLVAHLYAGYEEENGAVLMASGTIVDAYSRRVYEDTVTEIQLADGYAALRDTAVSLSYAAGSSTTTAIKAIAAAMGLTLNMSSSAAQKTWTHGFSYYGSARQALHKACRAAGLEWSIQNETIQVISIGGTTQRGIVVLNADSGLVGSPERCREGAREKRAKSKAAIKSVEQQRDGWLVRSLLLPWLNPGDAVRMQSTFLTGDWRVESVKHSGDYFGSDWTSDIKLVEKLT
jgi:hypothetical protein